MKTERLILGGGCFWCTEAVFRSLKGVTAVVSGYAGGHTVNPTYEQVAAGRTGHAEVVQIDFDANIIPLTTLLEVFLATHDATQKDGQGADVGPQYRSIILASDDEQLAAIRSALPVLAKKVGYDQPLATQIALLDHFWPAEPQHDNYYAKNSDRPYCRLVIDPKLIAARQRFSKLIK